MLVLGNGSSWSAIAAPLPGNIGPSPNSFAAPAIGCAKTALACAAAGSYRNTAGDSVALLLTGAP